MNGLRDSFGRHFTYLRLSLTEKCNFKCTYCLPNGCKYLTDGSDLKLGEIRNLLTGFRRLGFRKLRLTGGEPTLRRDLVDIVSLSKLLGFETVALSTNGYLLEESLDSLKRAGLDQINVSLDSLNPKKCAGIVGRDSGTKVLSVIHKAADMGFRKIKVNTVLLKGINDDELASFLSWIQDTAVSLRFIELMPTKENHIFFQKHHLKTSEWAKYLQLLGWKEFIRESDAGPAIELSHPDYKGNIGFINPFRSQFCDSCNRLRVSAKGQLRLCLFGKGSLPLRPYLQSEDQISNLIEQITASLSTKKIAHNLDQGDSGDTRTLAAIGG